MTGRRREDVTFPSGAASCAAWLYTPSTDPPHPVVVLAHGLGGVRKNRLAAFAERFAATGIAALAFDYRHFGDSPGEPRQIVSIRRQLEDWTSAVSYVRTREDVDADRVALWGTSFAGGHVHAIAARDTDIAAVIAQVPFLDGRAAARATSVLSSLRYAAAAVRDLTRAATRRAPHYVPLTGPPGTLAAMTAPGADDALHGLIDANDPDYIAARLFLALPRYGPGKLAGRIRCPILYVVADRDQVTPPSIVEQAAAAAGRAEVIRFPVDHFDVYTGDTFEHVVSAEERFLARHLLQAVRSDAV